jgi:hypothetical protein
MRMLLAAFGLTGCALAEHEAGPPPSPIEAVWEDSIHTGDMFVLVPGTGSYGLLGTPIDALSGPKPDVDVRTMSPVANDSIVFEQAIGAAHRAGITNAELEDGSVTFGIWGVGFTTRTDFIYVSYEGIRVPIHVLGGTSKCAVGSVPDNLLNYNTANAAADATDLYVKTQTWLTAHPNYVPQNVIVASHSWGGAVAEYLAFERDTIQSTNGPLLNATINFTIAMGVPEWVPSYSFAGPGLRDVTDGKLYEVDRPDDPVHKLDLTAKGGGHQYTILFGDDFKGSYGVTTEQLSCDGTPGPCQP